MPAARYIPPINTLDQKLQIQRRLGGLKSCKYFNLLTMYLNMKVSKPDFDKLCIALIGRENVPLHNHFLKSILKKACLSKEAPPRQSIAADPLKVKMPNGCNGLPPLGKSTAAGSLKVEMPNGCNGLPPLGKSTAAGSLKVKMPNGCNGLPPLGKSTAAGSLKVEMPNGCNGLPPLGKSTAAGSLKVEMPNGCNGLPPLGKSTAAGSLKVKMPNGCNGLPPLGKSTAAGSLKVEMPNGCNGLPPLGKSTAAGSLKVEMPNGCNGLPPLGKSTAAGSLKVKMPNGCNGLPPLGKNSRKCRTPTDRRIRHCPSPLGPHGKNISIRLENSTPVVQEHQIDIDIHHVGNGLHVSVEHREEANPDSERLSINRRSRIRAPLGSHGKNSSIGFENSTPVVQENQIDIDIHPVGNGLHVSVEHKEEVNPDSERLFINRRSPIRAPLGPHGKNNSIGFENSTPKSQEHQMDTDLHPVGNGFHVSVEHREEVNRDSEGLAINRRTPMRPPLGPHVQNNSIGFENSTPKFQEHQMDTDLHPVRKRPHLSVEHREEVNRDSERLAINRRTPMRVPLGPHVKNNSIGFENSTPKFQELQIDTDLHPVRNGFHVSVEPREEVSRDSERLAINRTPIRAPLGLPTYDNRAQMFTHQGVQSGIVTDTCHSIGYLPNTYSLMKRMRHNSETEGCNISADAAHLLNTALDVFLKRFIKPCLDIEASMSLNKFSGQIQPGINELPRNRRMQKPIGSASASFSDFRVAMEMNPTLLGEDWPLHFERTCILASEE